MTVGKGVLALAVVHAKTVGPDTSQECTVTGHLMLPHE